MAAKFDQKTTIQQLSHLSLSLMTFAICATYMLFERNWENSVSFWNSFVLPIIFIGEILKVALTRFFECFDNDFLLKKQQQYDVPAFSLLKMFNIIKGLVLQIICTMLYGFACVILGAPVFYYHEQTIILSLLLTLLTVSPIVFLMGGVGAIEIWIYQESMFTIQSKSKNIALKLFKHNAMGAILGAWAGSIVTPLDWDRDWQVYPIPNIVGSLIGCALCNLYEFIRILCATAKTYPRNNKDQN